MSSPHVSDSEPERELARSHSPMRRARANVTHSEQKRLDTASNLVHEFPQPKPVPVSLETRPSKYFNNGIELDIDEGDNSSTSLPPPIDIRRASSRSVSPPAAAQSRCTEAASSESPETSPRSKFARHLSSHFVYQPNSKGTSHNNYFATHSSSAAAPKSAHVPEASSSKSIVHDNKKKRAASKAPKAADFDTTITGILPLQVIGLVELCPVCKLRWTTRKTPAVKLAHMLSCAKENDYDLDTVRYLVDRHIRELHQQEEQQRLVNEPDKSLFDQVIRGAGKGVLRGGKAAKVQVVGLDAGAAASTQGGTLHNNVSGTQVSKEIDRSKRKLRPPTSKLSKAIKLLDADIPATGDPTPTSSEQSLHRQPSSKSLQAKTKPPGKLQPYTQSKDRLAQKAHQMFASGQLNPSPPLLSQSLPPSVSVANVISSNLAHKSTSLASGQLPLHTFAPVSASKGKARQVIELDDDDDDDDDDTDLELQPLELDDFNSPSSTQPLRASTLAQTSTLRTTSASDPEPQFTMAPSSTNESKTSLWTIAGNSTSVVQGHRSFRSIIPSPLPPSSTIFTSPSPSLNKPSIASPSSQMKRVQLSEPRANPEISPSRCFTSSAQQNGASRDESVSSYQSVQDYANWDLDALKAEASKFGYKPPGTKIACVNLLTRISGILSRRASAEPSSASVSTPTRASKTVSKKNSTKRAPPVIGSAGVSSAKGAGGAEKKPTSQGNSTPKKCRKGRVSAASMADAGEDFGADDADEGINVDSSFEEGMRQAILNDKDLWIKMLRYQPISFETFDRLATEKGLKHTAVGLRRYLDLNSVTFFTEGPHKDRNRGRRPVFTTGKKARSKRSKA